MATEEELRKIKARHSARLLKLPGVCGLGIEKNEAGDLVLAVHIDGSAPNAGADIPAMLEGHPLKRVLSGPFGKY